MTIWCQKLIILQVKARSALHPTLINPFFFQTQIKPDLIEVKAVALEILFKRLLKN